MALRLHTPSDAAGPPPGTIQALVDAYLEHAKIKLASSTLSVRTYDLRSFCAYAGGQLATDATEALIETYLYGENDWTPWTRRGKLQAIRALFNWGVRNKLIPEVPFKDLHAREGAPRRAMTDKEFAALLRHTDATFRRLLIFLRETGCRPGEASKLRWSDFDPNIGGFVLKEHKTAATQKRPKDRVIYLTPKAARLLGWMKNQGGASGTIKGTGGVDNLFLNTRGTPWNRCNLSLRMQRLRRAAGVDQSCKLYGTRHAWATRGVECGVDLKTIAQLMGSSYQIVERYYVKPQHASLRAAAEKISGGKVE